MIYVTGDCHGDYSKLSTSAFPEQKEMTRDDCVIICGDFGIWNNSPEERYWLDWLSKKPFTVLFVDGNHENFDRLYSEFPEMEYNGGRVHKITDNVLHLMRGYVFNINGKRIFAFGGASSHDVSDGILDRDDYSSDAAFRRAVQTMRYQNKMYRVNHVSWWKEELPSDEEMRRGLTELAKANNKVDFVVTHCAPRSIAVLCGYSESDCITRYLEAVSNMLKFKKWFFGHYHDNRNILSDYVLLYEQIVRID